MSIIGGYTKIVGSETAKNILEKIRKIGGEEDMLPKEGVKIND
jgi:hypothetical protein